MNKNIVKDNESGKSSTQNRNHLKEDHNNNINNNNNGNDNKNVNNNHQKSNKQANNSNATTVITSTHATIPQLIQEKPPPVSEDENPLEHAYTFWFSQRGRGAKNKTSAGDFEQNIKFICTVSSVEQFWKAYSRIIQPNDLTGRCDIHLFKYGIRPMWEDEANKNGGKWQVRLKKGVATRCWENLILAMRFWMVHNLKKKQKIKDFFFSYFLKQKEKTPPSWSVSSSPAVTKSAVLSYQSVTTPKTLSASGTEPLQTCL